MPPNSMAAISTIQTVTGRRIERSANDMGLVHNDFNAASIFERALPPNDDLVAFR